MKSERTRPSPVSYELMRAKKLRGRNRVNVVGASSPKDAKVSFCDSAEWYGAQTPGAHYSQEKCKLATPRVISPKLKKQVLRSPEQHSGSWLPRKTEQPGPGSYDTSRAIEQTQRRSIENVPRL